MRFRIGGIPDCPAFIPDESWRAMREPTPWLMQLCAIPLGFILFGAFVWLWLSTISVQIESMETITFLVLGILLFVPLIALHELIHMWVHPQSGRSTESILGFWPSRLLFFAHYEGEMSRNRFIAILAMPTLILSCLPLAVAMASGASHLLIAWVSSWNVLFACGDVFGLMLVFAQVPRNATVRNKGWRTFWKIK